MATNQVNLSDVSAEAEANAIAPEMNGGFIEIYSGTQPATANTALSGNTLLVTLTYSATAFGSAAAGGVITANAITSGTAVATGTASFARVFESNGTTVVEDMTVGVSGSGASLILATTAIVAGEVVAISSETFTATELG
jgi:hypothetical protein